MFSRWVNCCQRHAYLPHILLLLLTFSTAVLWTSRSAYKIASFIYVNYLTCLLFLLHANPIRNFFQVNQSDRSTAFDTLRESNMMNDERLNHHWQRQLNHEVTGWRFDTKSRCIQRIMSNLFMISIRADALFFVEVLLFDLGVFRLSDLVCQLKGMSR